MTQQEIENILNRGNPAEVKALVQANKKTTNIPTTTGQIQPAFDLEIANKDGFLPSVVRGLGGMGARVVQLGNYADNLLGFDLIDDNLAAKANQTTVQLEDFKKRTNNLAGAYTPPRRAEINKLEADSQNAKGFVENVIAGAKSAYDVVTHPSEITTQGIVENVLDPLNFAGFGSGAFFGKLTNTLTKKIALGAGAGAIEGGIVNGAGEYAIAKGGMKTDEEASKAGVQALGGGVALGAAMGGVGGAFGKIEQNNQSNTTKTAPVETKLSQNELLDTIKIKQKIKKQFNVKDEEVAAVIDEEIKANTTQKLQDLELVEQISNKKHQEEIGFAQGLDPLTPIDAIKQQINENIKLDPMEEAFTLSINDGTMVEPRLAGMRILNKLEKAIELNNYTPDEFYKTLRVAGYKEEVAKVLQKSYKDGNSDTFIDWVAENKKTALEAENEQIKQSYTTVAQKIMTTNKLKTDELNTLIDTVTEADFGLPDEQRNMMHELNNLGLVENIYAVNDKLGMAELGNEADGNYNPTTKSITVSTLGGSTPRGQVLTHEFVHSATAHLMHNNEYFKNDVSDLMNELKTNSQDINEYGFANEYEFVAEAFSNPKFANKLNGMQLSDTMKNRFGLEKSFVGSVWDAIVIKFSAAVKALTGEDFIINKGSYFDALNSVVSKEMEGLQKTVDEMKNDFTLEGGATELAPVPPRADLESLKASNSIDESISNPEIKSNIDDTNPDVMNMSREESISIIEKMRNEIEYDKLTDEEQSIYDVYLGNHSIAEIKSADLKDIILLEKGNRKNGAKKIIIKHGGVDKTGGLTPDELLSVGKVIRKGVIESDSFSETNNSIRYAYDYKSDNVGLRAVIEDFNDGRKVIDFYSDRNFIDYGNTPSYKKGESETTRQSQLTFLDKSISNPEIKSNIDNTNPDILKHKDVENTLIDTTLKQKDFSEKYDDAIDNMYNKISQKVRGVEADGSIAVKQTNPNPIFNAGDNFINWVRDNFITGGNIDEHFLNMIEDFDASKSFLKSEAKSIRDSLKAFDNKRNKIEVDGVKITKGAALVRALGGDLEPNMLPKDVKDMYDTFRNVLDANTKMLVDAGELKEEFVKENYLKRYYQDHIINKNLMSGLGGIKQNGKHKRADLDLATREEMNQIEEAGFVIAKTILEQRLQLEKANLLKSIADKYGKDAADENLIMVSKKTADDGFTKTFGALSGKFVPKYVHDAITGAFGVENLLGTLVPKITDHIKITMTVKNPSTHLYNALSNIYLSYMDGHFTQLAKVLWMAKNDKDGFSKLERIASKHGLNGFSVDLDADYMRERSENGMLVGFFKNLMMMEGTKIGEFMRSAYDWEDKIFKLAKFKDEMEKNNFSYDDEAQTKQAYSKVNEVYVDHSQKVGKAIRNLDKSGISPFLGYAFRSSPQVARLTLKHPIRFTLLHAVLAPLGASAIWNAISGEDEEQDKLKSDFMNQGGANMMGVESFVNIGKDSEGNDSFINAGRMAAGARMMPEKGNPLLLYSDGGFAATLLGFLRGKTQYGGVLFDENDNNLEAGVKVASAVSEYIVPPVAPAIPLIISKDKDVKYNKDGSINKRYLDKDGKIKKTDTISIGGRYGQKLNQAATGKKDRDSNPILMSDVGKQALGLKIFKVNNKATSKAKTTQPKFDLNTKTDFDFKASFDLNK